MYICITNIILQHEPYNIVQYKRLQYSIAYSNN